MKTFILFLAFNLLFCQNVLATDKVEVNTATLEQLDEITGIGPALAQRIIDGRPYSSIDDLLKVKGIGEKTLQKIKDQGLAYVNGKSEILNPNAEKSPNPSPSPSPTPAPVIIYPNNIFITEILPSPKGADETNEWIKIANLNDFEADLSGWKIKDTEGKTTTYVFFENTKIPANGFLILTRPETKISLNNDNDGLELIKPDKTIADSLKYEKAPIGQSYIRTEDNWKWSGNPASENANEPTTKNIVSARNNSAVSLGQANIKENTIENHPDFSAYLTAIFTAICSSAVILFLKSKLDKSNFFS